MNYAVSDQNIKPDQRVTYTVFPDTSASTKREVSGTWSELLELIKNPATHASKHECPLIVLGTFGEHRSDKACLRVAENRLTVSGIELDYDGEQVPMQKVADALAVWGIKAVLYTSASHTPEKPRYRVLLPLAVPCSPADRRRLVARVNGLLDGIMAVESYDVDRSYFFGRVAGTPYEALETGGDDCIDTMAWLDAGAIFPTGKAAANDHQNDDLIQIGLEQHPATDQQFADLRGALTFLAGKGHGGEGQYPEWEGIGQALKATANMGQCARESEALQLWFDYCHACGGHDGNPENLERDALRKWKQLRGDRTSMAAIFKKAQDLGWVNPQTQRAPLPVLKRAAFHFKSAADLMTTPAPVSYLIDGLIEANSLGLLFAPSGAGKSFVAIGWCACIATGAPWLGREVQAGAVFYLAGEGHAGISRRLKAWELHTEQELSNAPLFASNTSTALMDLKSVETVIQCVEDLRASHGAPALIVIDTFARNMGYGDENSTSDVSAFVNNIDAMRSRLGCSVILVHHTGHGESERGRGASALPAAMDSIFRIDKKTDGFELLNTKSKESEPHAPISLKLEQVPLHGWLDAKGCEMTSAVVIQGAGSSSTQSKPLTGHNLTAWNAYIGLLKDECVGVHIDAWRTAFYSTCKADTTNAKKSAFTRARSDLTEAGYLVRHDDVYRQGAIGFFATPDSGTRYTGGT